MASMRLSMVAVAVATTHFFVVPPQRIQESLVVVRDLDVQDSSYYSTPQKQVQKQHCLNCGYPTAEPHLVSGIVAGFSASSSVPGSGTAVVVMALAAALLAGHKATLTVGAKHRMESRHADNLVTLYHGIME